MKTLSKIKLNQFSKNELDQRALNALKGGCTCGYSCSCDCNAGAMSPLAAFSTSSTPNRNMTVSY